MIKIYFSSIQPLVSTKLHIEEQFQVKEHEKNKEKYITQYIEEIEYIQSVYCKSA